MNLNEWLENNKTNFGSDYETLFAKTVLPLVPELSFDAISVQYPFQDRDRQQRYCDFVIQENDDVRIAIEIDGYDKRGTGMGMSHADFVDWQRRQAALTSQGWYVLRFANRDVRDEPKRCAEHISLLLKRSRSSSQHKELSAGEKERLDALTKAQNNTIEHLNKETSVMKYTVAAFTTLILALVMVIVWQGGGFSTRQSQATVQSPVTQPQPTMPSPNTETQKEQRVQSAATQPQPNVPRPNTSIQKEQPVEIAVIQPQPTTLSAAHNTEMPAVQVTNGPTCDDPISWQKAGQHIGQTAAVVGPLMKVTYREDARGNPTWIDIGAVFPNSQRLGLVIWGEQKSNFPMVMPGQLEGRNVCIIGQIKSYKGTPQIELRTANQFNVLH